MLRPSTIGTMDPASLLSVLNHQPLAIEEHRVIFQGALTPVVVPVDWIAPQQLGHWALADENADFPLRVRLALNAQLEDEAWQAIEHHQGGRGIGLELERVLALWAAREQQRLELPNAHGGLILAGVERSNRANYGRQLAVVITEMRTLFDSLPWPRWGGPVLIADPLQRPDLTQRYRPALPVIEADFSQPLVALRQHTGEQLAALILHSAAAPESGWPAWLSHGLQKVAGQRAMGRMPSPLGSLRQRQRAGGAAIHALLHHHEAPLNDEQQELATALVVLLTSDRRRQQLASLLDLIRNGMPSSEAIVIAYGLSLDDLLIER